MDGGWWTWDGGQVAGSPRAGARRGWLILIIRGQRLFRRIVDPGGPEVRGRRGVEAQHRPLEREGSWGPKAQEAAGLPDLGALRGWLILNVLEDQPRSFASAVGAAFNLAEMVACTASMTTADTFVPSEAANMRRWR